MKYQKLLLLSCLFATLITQDAIAQAELIPTTYNKGFIHNEDGSIVKIKNLVVSDGYLNYRLFNSSRVEKIVLEDVNHLRVATGTQAVKGAGIGLAIAGGVVAGSALRIALDPNYVFRENALTIYGSIIGGGALIGLLAGATITEYKNIYNPHIYFQSGKDIGYISLRATSNGIGIGITF